MASTTIPLKRGDHFVAEGIVFLNGTEHDVSDWGIRAHLNRGNQRVSDLEVLRVGGRYRLRDTATAGWPLGTLTGDIEYTLPSGQVVSTETFEVEVERDETR